VEVFKVIDAIFIIAVGIWMLYAFNKHCIEKHNYSFFTQKSFITVTISFGLILVGYDWYLTATLNNKSIVSGVIMMILGANIGLILFFKSSYKTNYRYAFGGLFIKFIIISGLAYIVTFILL